MAQKTVSIKLAQVKSIRADLVAGVATLSIVTKLDDLRPVAADLTVMAEAELWLQVELTAHQGTFETTPPAPEAAPEPEPEPAAVSVSNVEPVEWAEVVRLLPGADVLQIAAPE